MSTARKRMLDRYRFEALDADHLAAEADGLIARAQGVLDRIYGQAGIGILPATIREQLQQLADGVRGLINGLEHARSHVAGDANVVDAHIALRDALAALERAAAAVPATKRAGTVMGDSRPARTPVAAPKRAPPSIPSKEPRRTSGHMDAALVRPTVARATEHRDAAGVTSTGLVYFED